MTAPITGIGIDFGTTNSVVALAYGDGRVESRTWPTADGPTPTFRTALTFWREGGCVRHVAGPEAIARAEAPLDEQRFVQSLKTHLASRAFAETRLYGRRFTIEALIATFLTDLTAGQVLDGPIVGGRPVTFAGHAADEAIAISRLTAAFAQAGMANVTLAYEPLGAAYWYARALKRDETVLVADFGGGTSDFSVMRFSQRDGRQRGAGQRDGRRRASGGIEAAALSHAGIGIAGDTFDYRIIDHAVSPRLGKGATYRSFDKALPIPAYLHASLAQWHQLSWLKSGNTLAELRKLAAASDRGDELEALATIVEMDMGLALYRAVGETKSALSRADRATLRFSGWGIAIEADVSRGDFEGWIADDLAAIESTIDEALRRAGIRDDEVDAVFLTGGTSFVPAVRNLFARRFPPERLHQGDAFQSVASGLAMLAADRADAGRGRGSS